MDRSLFERQLKAFWKHPARQRMLKELDAQSKHVHVLGWTSGGCALAAEALYRWITTTEVPDGMQVSLVCIGKGLVHATVHVMLRFCIDGQETFLDTKGFWSKDDLLDNRFADLSWPAIVPYRGALEDGFAFDEPLCTMLVAQITKAFDSLPWEVI